MAYGNLKQNLAIGQWVRIGAMPPGNELEGMIGRIAGKSSEQGVCDFYIVLLTKKLTYKDDVALTIIESCLEPYNVQCGRTYSLGASFNGSDAQP